MGKVIITTVGTSIFTNYQSDRARALVGRDYEPITDAFSSVLNLPALKIHDSSYRVHADHLSEIISELWFEIGGRPNDKASAEICSILRIAEQGEEACNVHLIATDTFLSVLAAELICSWFEKYKKASSNIAEVRFQRPIVTFEKQNDSNFVIKDLRVKDNDSYEKGFHNLLGLLNNLLRHEYNQKKNQVVFNITGGYKAIVPIMTLYAQLENIELAYLYEPDDALETDLITIGQLPFHFDYGEWEMLSDYVLNDEFIKKLDKDSKILKKFVENSILERESLNLTVLGDLLKSYLEKKTDVSKTMFGYVAELLVFEYFQKEGKAKVLRGDTYYWEEKSDNYRKKSFSGGVQIEIDIRLVDESSGGERWYEIKPLNQAGIQKVKDQLLKRVEFNKKAFHKNLQEIGAIFYKYDVVPLAPYLSELKELVLFFKEEGVQLKIFCFDLELKSKMSFSAKQRILQRGLDKLEEVSVFT